MNHNNHNHNNGSHDSKMMWFMMLGCLLPVIILAFSGSGIGSDSLWWLLGAGALMLGLHAFAMRGRSGQKIGNVSDSQSSPVDTTGQTNPISSSQSASNAASESSGHNHH